jgi:hypothetical protein
VELWLAAPPAPAYVLPATPPFPSATLYSIYLFLVNTPPPPFQTRRWPPAAAGAQPSQPGPGEAAGLPAQDLWKFSQTFLFSESFRENMFKKGANPRSSLTFFAIFAQNLCISRKQKESGYFC